MKTKYPEYTSLNLPELERSVLEFWERENVFERSVSNREGSPSFTFFEGPPSANGMPGIHHALSRAIKDTFCRYKTLRGHQVKRKAGWDTHGLPVELQVEKALKITKEDIGKKISIAEYNQACREDVMRYTDAFNEMTRRLGYWVDLDNPYITYENEYIETVWSLLQRLYQKDMLYKGYTIQPYSPAAGTGLSSHELNQPGCYREVKDSTAVAMFRIQRDEKAAAILEGADAEAFFLAWTTTPWTLPSNTALAVGARIAYGVVRTFNPYTYQPQTVILAMDLLHKYFPEKDGGLALTDYKPGDKALPYQVLRTVTGADLAGMRYDQLLPYVDPGPGAFRVVTGDFVTTSDGTGIVHIAPTFGADDFRVAAQNGVPALLVKDEEGNPMPLVDRKGRFVQEVTDFPGEYVKEAYYSEAELRQEISRLKHLPQDSELHKLVASIVGRTDTYLSVDERIVLKLQLAGQLFRKEKYEHSYPHCWRTDKPVLYYPLDSWFIRTTAVRDRLIELNKTINWKPQSTGEGRFGNWLENLVDWNLSRSRYWGIPLPIWMTEDAQERLCIGSVAELITAAEAAIAAGFMTQETLDSFRAQPDLHRPHVDAFVLVSPSGKPMRRELDLIDVWFDSGAMPYAQWHYPFENQDIFQNSFPADFIAEGVDQTRGWFFTLHAIAVMLFDSVAFKNVISTGLLLDKDGRKMSKRYGNTVNPFVAFDLYSADATRWYMMGNTPPWDNLRFSWEKTYESPEGERFIPDAKTDPDKILRSKVVEERSEGILEVVRKFFGTLHNTYQFFAMYANVDGFTYAGPGIPVPERTELDRWIMSLLNSLVLRVQESMDDYDPTRAIRAMEAFMDSLSNWFVRLSRRRFWKGEMNRDKESAYETLYDCLMTLSQLMSPFAPFYAERLFRDLNTVTGRNTRHSVHLSDWPVADPAAIDPELEAQMDLAQHISSLVHSIRKNPVINVPIRQPLARVLVPVMDEAVAERLGRVQDLILQEINVKTLSLIRPEDDTVIVRKAKPNFKALGPKLGPRMKEAAAAIQNMSAAEIASFDRSGEISLAVGGETVTLTRAEIDIVSQDVPGWAVATGDGHTVALDLTLSDALRNEGLARNLVNRIQNLRKSSGLEVTDRIRVRMTKVSAWEGALNEFLSYICTEILATGFETVPGLENGSEIEIDDTRAWVQIEKHHG